MLGKVTHPTHACLQASARRSSEDGFGSVVGGRSRQSSQSPLSPATSGPNMSMRRSQMNGTTENGRTEASRRARSEDPSSPTLQPNSTPPVAQTPTLGTGDKGLTSDS